MLLAESIHRKGYGFTFLPFYLKAYQLEADQAKLAFGDIVIYICIRTVTYRHDSSISLDYGHMSQ